MTLRVEVDLPSPGEVLPLSELRAFVAQAIAAGAGPGSPVTAVAPQQDTSMTIALRAEIEDPTPAPRTVTLDVDLIREVLGILDASATLDGDARPILREINEVRQQLLDAVIGVNPAALDPAASDSSEA